MPEINKDQQKIAMLSMTLSSLQSNLSEYALRARQAEEMVGVLSSSWDHAQIGAILAKHIEQKSQERAIHLQDIVQTTQLALQAALKSDDAGLREIVNNVTKELTTATMNLHQLLTKEAQLKQRSQNGTTSGH
jgi:hypothetical protein